MRNSNQIECSRRGSIAVLTLNRPEKHNALTQEMRDALARLWAEFAGDDSVRAVVLTGAGEKAFCAGTDVGEFRGRTGIEQWERDLDPNRLFEAMERFPKPLIAAINGYALGGGCELALACDIRLCSETAQLGLPEINFSLMPGGGGTQKLARLAGKGQAMRLILSGEKIPAAEALRIGLVEVLVPQNELKKRAEALARKIAQHDAAALRCAKEAIRACDETTLLAGLSYEAALMGICLEEGGGQAKIREFFQKSHAD